MEAQLRLLEDIKGRIQKGLINFKKSPKDRINQAYVDSRLEILEKQFKDFTRKHEELLRKYTETELNSTNYIKDDVFDAVTDIFLTYEVELKNALPNSFQSCNTSEASPDRNQSKINSIAKLPKITIPIFSGKYQEWSTFRDLFLSLIDSNESLDDVQRLHYLRSQLSGEAAQLIRHIPITHANYNKCWTLLNSRYNNKRFLANCILKRLLNQKQMTVESSIALKELLDTTSDCLHELSNLGVQVDAWDIIVIYLISSKLDVETRKQWELQVSQFCDELPTFEAFRDFLEKRFRALEFVEPQSSKPKSSTRALHIISKLSCPLCSEEHLLCHCKKFIQESVDQRRQIAKTHGLCFNCLRSSHLNINCRMNIKCRICNRKHRTLLHLTSDSNAEASSSASPSSAIKEPPQNESTAEPHISNHFAKNLCSQVLLATAVVKARSRNGYCQVLRALLDQGSQASFITESAVQLLKLKKIAVNTTISGLGGGHSDLTSKYMVQVNIQSVLDPNFNFQINAYVLSRVSSILPEKKFTLVDWPELHSIELADPNFNKPSKIDILLGSEAYTKVLKEGLIKDPRGKTMAQDTYLGWIVSGEVEDKVQSYHRLILSMHARVKSVKTDQILKGFWESEEAEPARSERSMLSPEEQACEDYFAATSVINEYLLLGHMEGISNEIDKNKIGAVYLPHHGVIREDRLTTKLRVVFDTSAKVSDGVSLNDTLMVGPSFQPDLRHTVMRWQLHPVCLVAVIVKMNRQVKVAVDHVDFQRILWRVDFHSDVKEYRLLRVTFGTSSAPYLAVRALPQTACDEGKSYPYAASRIMTDFYIQCYLMTGCHTEEEAVKICHEFNEIVRNTGFSLQKWTSNREDLLKRIELDTGRNLEIKEDETTRILGLTWNRISDEFHYSVNLPFSTSSSSPLPPSASETKRSVTSEISCLYDPLDWIASCIITAKVFIQKLWIAGLDWDDELSEELLNERQSYRRELQTRNNFKIPRWLQRKSNDQTVKLHGFSNASSIAYTAAVYIRVIDSDGRINCNLVTAKIKVAPIKQISIPRLELCGVLKPNYF